MPREKRSSERGSRRPRRRVSDTKLRRMIEEATVDAYGDPEQTVGFFTMMEDNLAVPFRTELLGVEVTVERLALTDEDGIVAVCARGRSRQRIPILDLPLPTPAPHGAEWIEAYRLWRRGG